MTGYNVLLNIIRNVELRTIHGTQRKAAEQKTHIQHVTTRDITKNKQAQHQRKDLVFVFKKKRSF